MSKQKLIFTEETIWIVLEVLGKAVNEHGFVIDKTTKELVLDAEGNKFKPSQIVAISKEDWYTNIFQMTNA